MLANQPSRFNATRLNMQRLIMLRSVVMVCLSLVIFILRQASVPLPLLPLSLAIVALGVLNLIAWWRLKHTQQTNQAITQRELLLQLLGDIAALSVLFYFSGGYSNPFIWMYLLPITVAAVALRAAYAWLIASLSITCYTLLMFYHVPLSHLHLHARMDGQGSVQLDIHLVGMWIGFVVSSIIVAIFIARIGQNLRDYDKAIGAVREKALESERMLALGALATRIAAEQLCRSSSRTDQQRQMHVARQGRRKYLAVRIDQLRCALAPTCRRLMLLDTDLDTRRPAPTHIGMTHPRQLLQRLAQRLQIDTEKIAAQQTGQCALDLAAPYLLQFVRHRDLAQGEEGQPGRPHHRCNEQRCRRRYKQQVGNGGHQLRFVPHRSSQ